MASRRKYRTPKAYRDGGAVIPDDVAPAPALGADVPPVPEPAALPAEPAAAPPPDALRLALEASRRAEELQRQARQAQKPMTVKRYVDSLEGLTDHKRAFLKSHPELLSGSQRQAMSWSYRTALADGIPDDTPEMNERILSGVRLEMERERQRQIESARAAADAVPMMPEPTIEKTADRLDREANAVRATMSAAASTPLALAAELPPAEPRRRSIPISAPVSRDVPSLSGRPPSASTSVTLSPEERVVARASMSWLKPVDAEREYAKNKQRLAALRASGEYPERERN